MADTKKFGIAAHYSQDPPSLKERAKSPYAHLEQSVVDLVQSGSLSLISAHLAKQVTLIVYSAQVSVGQLSAKTRSLETWSLSLVHSFSSVLAWSAWAFWLVGSSAKLVPK